MARRNQRDVNDQFVQVLAATSSLETTEIHEARAVFDALWQEGYMAKMAAGLRAASIERGVLLRPLGNVLYAMPPACTTPAQAKQIGTVMAEMALLPSGLGI